MYTNDRDAYRQAFYTAWQKHLANKPLELLETQLVDVMLLHPEYHHFLSQSASNKQEFELEENPFFHMSLHLAIAEQLRMDRPAGIKAIFIELENKFPDQHTCIHQMMQCLAQTMWQAQKTGTAPDEQTYLNALREHCK